MPSSRTQRGHPLPYSRLRALFGQSLACFKDAPVLLETFSHQDRGQDWGAYVPWEDHVPSMSFGEQSPSCQPEHKPSLISP